MPNQLLCTNFSSTQFPALSAAPALSATHNDVMRAMMTVGYPSTRAALTNVGRWRAVMLRAMVRGYIDDSLCTTVHFRNLEQSERGAVTFLLAQAMTLWFAQEHLNLLYLVHVRGCDEHWTASSSRLAAKKGAAAIKSKSRPDFIGYDSAGKHYVFETKGRTRRVFKRLIPTALAQVSVVAKVNGIAPASRIAACFAFRPTGIEGQLQDPPVAQEATDLKYDESIAIRKAYAIFRETWFREEADDSIPGFLSIDLGDEVRVGIDHQVFKSLEQIKAGGYDQNVGGLRETLTAQRAYFRQRRSNIESIGMDGVLLRNPRALSTPTQADIG